MMRMRIVSFCSIIILWIGSGLAFCLPEAKLTIKVVTEEGQPIELARVGIGFETNTGWGTEEIPVIGFSDGNGLFTGSARGNDSVGFTVSKDGYYNSYGIYYFKKDKSGHWEPWNPTVPVVLRKIEKPVPMHSRDTEQALLEIPVAGKDVGFDLAEYDWLPPHGNGKSADFIFKLNRKFIKDDNFESTLTITFSMEFDGIQTVKENRKYGSTFKLPRFAPKLGYKNKLIRKVRSVPGKPLEYDFEEDNNYIFRVRSEEKDGKFVRAMYGKIHGDIRFDPRGSKTALIGFTYFLNPDYTRNLEFDSKRNLFTNRRSTEQVGL